MTVARARKPLTLSARSAGWAVGAYTVACALPIVTAFVIKALTLPVPFWDEWAWAHLLYSMHNGTLHIGDLWQQHNEHRMLVPNAIALGLAALGGWSQLRETLFSLLVVVFTQIGLFVLLRRIVAAAKLPFAFAVVSLMLYSLAQIENWDWGFQIAWFLCNACAVWALLMLGASGQSWFALVAAAALATIASFSSSQGLMIWPAGLATLCLTEKRRPAQIGAWIALAVIVFLTYFHGYEHPPTHPDALLGLHHPLAAARYIGLYFGSVFAGWIGRSVAIIVGWVVLLGFAFLIWLAVRDFRSDRRQVSRMASFVGLGLYAICVGVITTAGRLGLGEDQAGSSRYGSIAIYVWVTIVALGFAFGNRVVERLPRNDVRLLPVLLGLFILLYAGSDWAGVASGKARLAEVRSAYPAIMIGHGPALTALYPIEGRVEVWLGELRIIKDGPYYQ